MVFGTISRALFWSHKPGAAYLCGRLFWAGVGFARQNATLEGGFFFAGVVWPAFMRLYFDISAREQDGMMVMCGGLYVTGRMYLRGEDEIRKGI